MPHRDYESQAGWNFIPEYGGRGTDYLSQNAVYVREEGGESQLENVPVL